MHCCGKRLTVEPLGQGHIFRTQMRVKDGNKTVLITYPENISEKGWGCSSEEPDMGKSSRPVLPGAHSNLGATTPTRGAAIGFYSAD